MFTFIKLLRKNTSIFLNEECKHAFQGIKAYLIQALALLNSTRGELVYLYHVVTT